jgi:hypothetical protein
MAFMLCLLLLELSHRQLRQWVALIADFSL